MNKYIDFNSKLRTAAKNDFEKDFYKLMNNSVSGKIWQHQLHFSKVRIRWR